MNYLKTNGKSFALIMMLGGLLFSCTDLKIEETDSLLADGFTGLSADEAASTISGMYNNLNGYIGDQGNLYAMSEVTSDAQLIPTRGSDWGDNGLWRQMHTHGWTADHAFITNVWNQWNELQLTASQVIDSRSSSSASDVAEASFLRALGMYVILDNYGQIPFRDTTAPPLDDPEVFTGSVAVDFIVADLQTAIAGLSSAPAGGDYPRATKVAAKYLLAKVLLNKHIYTASAVDAADMTSVISLVDEITAEGYQIQSGYFDIFKEDSDTETIWYLPTAVGNRIFNTLHYNTSTGVDGGGWNGFSALAEYYDLFEGDANNNRLDASGNPIDGQEERRGGVPPAGVSFTGEPGTSDAVGNLNAAGEQVSNGITDGSNIGNGFLIGQQYSENGDALTDRSGNALVFGRDFVNASGALSLVDNNEITGIRLIKYNPRFGAFKQHEIFFRYSDAYLMKAEAMMRSGGDATAMVNSLRTIRGATPLGAVTEAELLAERGRELYCEFWRRNDLIRFGQYTRDWVFKDAAAIGNSDKQLFPIPSSQVILNPNLVQNPGY